MSASNFREAIHKALKAEMRRLRRINRSDRPSQMPLAASLAIALPLLIGAYFGRMDFGLVSSLGGLVFLYMPPTPLYHRMVMLMACAFAMIACYMIGLICQFVPVVAIPVLAFVHHATDAAAGRCCHVGTGHVDYALDSGPAD